MTKKILEMYYTTIQTLQENEVIPHFLTLLQEKFTETAGTSHKINCSVNPAEKQITAIFDGNIKIVARITNYNVRSEFLAQLPELMKIFENVKKGLAEEYADAENPESLSTLVPVMHIHSCTVEIYPDSSTVRKYEYAAKKLIEQITRNKTIIMLR